MLVKETGLGGRTKILIVRAEPSVTVSQSRLFDRNEESVGFSIICACVYFYYFSTRMTIRFKPETLPNPIVDCLRMAFHFRSKHEKNVTYESFYGVKIQLSEIIQAHQGGNNSISAAFIAINRGDGRKWIVFAVSRCPCERRRPKYVHSSNSLNYFLTLHIRTRVYCSCVTHIYDSRSIDVRVARYTETKSSVKGQQIFCIRYFVPTAYVVKASTRSVTLVQRFLCVYFYLIFF
jgi:hypothetical protein